MARRAGYALLIALVLACPGAARGDARGPAARSVHLDIGGEGRHARAINVNPERLTTTTGLPGRPIPNLIVGTGEALPVRAASVDKVLVENAALRPGSEREIARVLKRGGTVRLVHPSGYATRTHGLVAAAVQGRHQRRVVGGITISRIRAPR